MWPKRSMLWLFASVMLLLGMSTLLSRTLAELSNGSAWLVHTEHVRVQIAKVMQLVTDVTIAERSFALNRDEHVLQPIVAAKASLDTEARSLQRLIEDNPVQRPPAARLRALANARLSEAEHVIERVRAGDSDAATLVERDSGAQVMAEVRDIVSQMQAEELRLLEARRGELERAQDNAALAQWLNGGIAIALLILIVYVTISEAGRVARAQKELATTLRSIGDAIVSTDADGVVRFMNDVAERLTGWPEPAAKGQLLDNVFRIFNEETRAAVESPIRKVIREGTVAGLANHTILVARDGSERPIEDSAAPLFGDMGNLVGVVLVFRDVTTERAAQRALETSEARFRAVQETSIDGFMVFESIRNERADITDFRWVYANQASERILARERGWFNGRQLLCEMPGHRDAGLFDTYVRVVETGEPWSEELAYRHEGLDLYLRIVAAKCADGFAVSFQDLTDRRRIEEEVRESERRFIALANAVPQLTWINNQDGRNTYHNQRWSDYTGLTEEELNEDGGWTRVIHPDDLERAQGRWADSQKSAAPYEVEYRIRRADGSYRWFLGRAVPYRDDQDRVLRWFGTCTDIDSTKRLEESLRAATQALREADTRKDMFLATLAHELRNPLAPIRTAAALLESQSLRRADIERCRAIISRQVRHMASLLDDLLDISRITRGSLELKNELIMLPSLVDAAVEMARPMLDAKRHILDIEYPTESIELRADPVRLTQVLTNLLTNAAKYTDPGGSVKLRAELIAEQLVISVRDNGIGLTEAMLPQVFQMFSQVHANTKRSEGGLGIGLALVKGIVELHGGSVEVRSEGIGKGSEFVVVLPRTRMTDAASKHVPAVETATMTAASGRRILLADDNQDAAELLARLLELSGHEVHIANTGTDALKLAYQHRPDTVILDIGMPGMNGYEVARNLRRDAWGAQATLIAITGWGGEQDKRQALDSGFDYHLSKPVDPSELDRILSPTP